MSKSKPKFVRTDSFRFSRLGKNRRKLQVWRSAKGMHSKIRRRREGYPAIPTIGYGSPKELAGKVNGLTPVLVHNLNELQNLNKHSIAIIARIGAKKKIEMLKKASELGIKVMNAGVKHESK